MRETRYWALNILSALVILFLLTQHMALMHLDGFLEWWLPEWVVPLSWAGMLQRGSSFFYASTYVLLLGLGLFHGLYGVNNILVEFVQGASARKMIRWACWAVGLLLFGIGSAVTLSFYLVSG